MEHIGEFSATIKTERKTAIPVLTLRKYTCKQKENTYIISFSLSMGSYTISGNTFPLAKAISANGKTFSIARNKFLKKVKAWRKDIYLEFPREKDIPCQEIVLNNRPLSLGEMAQHWYRIDRGIWKSKHHSIIKAGNGKKYFRAELLKDTGFHYKNCGSIVPQFQYDFWKWDKTNIEDNQKIFNAIS